MRGIEESPLQVYTSALVFSPSQSIIRKLFQNEEPPWLLLKPTVEKMWGEPCPALENRSRVTSLVFSPNGQRLASGSRDGTVRMWDVATGALQWTFNEPNSILYLFKRQQISILFSPDGQRLISNSLDSGARVWNVATGTLQYTLNDYNHKYSKVFSPDGQRLASGSWDTRIRVWNIATGALQCMLNGSSGEHSIAFSPDGQRLASSLRYGEVRVWDVATGALQCSLNGSGCEHSIAFSPDGQQLASGWGDGAVRVWNMVTGALQWRLNSHNYEYWRTTRGVSHNRYSHLADNGLLGVGETVRCKCGTQQRAHSRERSSKEDSTFLFDEYRAPGSRESAAQVRDGAIQVWDAATGALQRTIEGDNTGFSSIDFSRDGSYLSTDRGTPHVAFSRDGCYLFTDRDTSYVGVSRDRSYTFTDPRSRSFGSRSPPTVPQQPHNDHHVRIDGKWIVCDGRRLLYLHSGYQASCSAINTQFIAVGCNSGRVWTCSLSGMIYQGTP